MMLPGVADYSCSSRKGMESVKNGVRYQAWILLRTDNAIAAHGNGNGWGTSGGGRAVRDELRRTERVLRIGEGWQSQDRAGRAAAAGIGQG